MISTAVGGFRCFRVISIYISTAVVGFDDLLLRVR